MNLKIKTIKTNTKTRTITRTITRTKTSTKTNIIFRVSWSNRLSFPILLNAWEQEGLDSHFKIKICDHELLPSELQPGDVILYSFMTPTLPGVAQEVQAIKKHWGNRVIIVAGGPHITGDQELAHDIGFDILFVGPAEQNFIHFGYQLLDNKGPQLAENHTIYHYSPLINTHQDNISNDSNQLNSFLPVSRNMFTVSPLEIMRGCYWHCKYCSTHIHPVAFRDFSSIKRYLDEVKKRHIARVNFISPSSMEFGSPKGRTLNLDKLQELLELTHSYRFRFIEYGIFPSEVRPDTITDQGLALLKKYVSNKYVTIGAQSALDERLRLLRRAHSSTDIEQAIAIAYANHFKVNLDFIVGYPDESPAERHATIAFIKKLNKQYQLHSHIHHFIPLSGSPYQFRFPAFLPIPDKENLLKLKSAGYATDGWVNNEIQALNYLDWLKNNFPHYYSRFH